MKHLYNTGIDSDHDAFDVKLHDSATLKVINGKGSITLSHPLFSLALNSSLEISYLLIHIAFRVVYLHIYTELVY